METSSKISYPKVVTGLKEPTAGEAGKTYLKFCYYSILYLNPQVNFLQVFSSCRESLKFKKAYFIVHKSK